MVTNSYDKLAPIKVTEHLSNVVRKSTMIRPHVRVMGKSATICYVRLLQEKSMKKIPPPVTDTDKDSTNITQDSAHQYFKVKSYEETRIWQLDSNGNWRNVYLHKVELP